MPANVFRPVALLAVVLAGVVAAPALASAPTPKSKTIVPVTSIGGIKLGTPYAAALKTWGAGSDCQTQDETAAAAGTPIDRSTYLGSCTWRDGSDTAGGPALGKAELFFKDGKVRWIALSPQQNASYFPTSKGPIGKFKIKGTKLGMASPIASVSRKLHATSTGYGVEVTKGGKYLGFSSSGGRVAGITLGFTADET